MIKKIELRFYLFLFCLWEETKMENSKEQILKDLLSMRRRMDLTQLDDTREIEIFEEQVAKSSKRIEQNRYLAKKFNREELIAIYKAYESIKNGHGA